MNHPALPANDGASITIDHLAQEEGRILHGEPYFGFRWDRDGNREVPIKFKIGAFRVTADHLRIAAALARKLQVECHHDGTWTVAWGKPRTLMECPMLSAQILTGGPLARLEPRGADLSQARLPKLLQASWLDNDGDIHFRLSSTDGLDEIYAAGDLLWCEMAEQAHADYHTRLASLELRPGIDTYLAAKGEKPGPK